MLGLVIGSWGYRKAVYIFLATVNSGTLAPATQSRLSQSLSSDSHDP